MGPIQTQVARSAYTGLAARRPGTTHDEIEAAYESGQIVRGTSLRGTVHSFVAAQHPILDAVTRHATAGFWRRTLGAEPSAVQAEMESFAHTWRTPAELRAHLSGWLTAAGGPELKSTAGESLAHSHSGFVRRPVAGTGWNRQTAPEYAAAAVLDSGRALPEFADALDALCELHVRAHGPSALADIVWWSGETVREIDASLARLREAGILQAEPGPGEQEFYDLPGTPLSGPDPGTRLLAEFDALVCGYAPKNRGRFVDAAAKDHYWISVNGIFSSVVLHDGRLRGSWKLTGTGKKRGLEVRMFPGEPTLGRREMAPSVAALETVLATTVTEVSIVSA